MEATKAWHWSSMRPLAWLETAIKLIAFAIIFFQARQIIGAGHKIALPPDAAGIVVLSIAVVLLLGLLAGIMDRVADRELFAMGFILLNVSAHGSFVFALVSAQHNGLFWFPGLMLLGDLVKLLEIRIYHMRVREFGSRVLYILTGVYVAGYVLILLLL